MKMGWQNDRIDGIGEIGGIDGIDKIIIYIYI